MAGKENWGGSFQKHIWKTEWQFEKKKGDSFQNGQKRHTLAISPQIKS